jgi:hypothetical protein
VRVLAFLAALVVAPWLHPLAFHPLAGWETAASGNTLSVYAGPGKHVAVPLEATAWIAKNVRYRDNATADPPNATLAHLQPNSVIVWAVIFTPSYAGQKPISLDLGKANHNACCEAVGLAAGEYELAGNGPGGAYFVIVRIYFGSRPTKATRAEAQQALRRLALPLPG